MTSFKKGPWPTGRPKTRCSSEAIRPGVTYSATTAAAALGMSPNTIRASIDADELEGTRYRGLGTYIKGESLLAWVEERNREADAREATREHLARTIHPDVWYSCRLASEAARVSNVAIREAAKSGDLKAVRRPSGTYIRGSDLLVWLQTYKSKPTVRKRAERQREGGIQPDIWYAVTQAARTAHIDHAAASAAAKSGALKAERYPTITYVLGSDFLAWLAEYRQEQERRAAEREKHNRIKQRQDVRPILAPVQCTPRMERHAASSIAACDGSKQRNPKTGRRVMTLAELEAAKSVAQHKR